MVFVHRHIQENSHGPPKKPEVPMKAIVGGNSTLHAYLVLVNTSQPVFP
jgi:hypothetical protein